jgi:hypothetical protein
VAIIGKFTPPCQNYAEKGDDEKLRSEEFLSSDTLFNYTQTFTDNQTTTTKKKKKTRTLATKSQPVE